MREMVTPREIHERRVCHRTLSDGRPSRPVIAAARWPASTRILMRERCLMSAQHADGLSGHSSSPASP